MLPSTSSLENIRTRGKTKLTRFPRDLTLSVLLYENNRSEPKQSTRYLQQHKFNSQNRWMNDLQSTFLILSASFSSTSCCFSSGNFLDNFKNRWWGFVLVLLCSFTKKKPERTLAGSIFPAFCHATFHRALITCCNVASLSGVHCLGTDH